MFKEKGYDAPPKLTAVELKRQALQKSRLAYQKAKAEGKLKPIQL